MAAYSGTPLVQKLGIQPGMKIWLWQAPHAYDKWVGAKVRLQLCSARQTPDLVHLFAASVQQMETLMLKLKPVIARNPKLVIWVSWYKKSSKIPTDLTEDMIRDYALNNGLVDVKVCAVNDEWSALKLVVPLKNR